MTRDDGAFTFDARASITARDDYRCVGCGAAAPLTIQHRRPRGMGGTSRRRISDPANGVTLCGSGTTGCHGWAEAHPTDAELLGWRITGGVDAGEAAYWSHTYGWRRVTPDGLAVFVYPPDIVDEDVRAAAVGRFLVWLEAREAAS